MSPLLTTFGAGSSKGFGRGISLSRKEAVYAGYQRYTPNASFVNWTHNDFGEAGVDRMILFDVKKGGTTRVCTNVSTPFGNATNVSGTGHSTNQTDTGWWYITTNSTTTSGTLGLSFSSTFSDTAVFVWVVYGYSGNPTRVTGGHGSGGTQIFGNSWDAGEFNFVGGGWRGSGTHTLTFSGGTPAGFSILKAQEIVNESTTYATFCIGPSAFETSSPAGFSKANTASFSGNMTYTRASNTYGYEVITV